MKSIFDIYFQQRDLDSRFIIALERLSRVFRNLLWEEVKKYNLSPIQIQFIVLLYSDPDNSIGVSQLAEKFNLTKATVSDAVSSLVRKKIIVKKINAVDKRIINLSLTKKGKDIASELIGWPSKIQTELRKHSAEEKTDAYIFLLKLIESFERIGIISRSRMCITCRFYELKSGNTAYCNLLQKELTQKDLRIDCPEHELAEAV